MIVETGAIVPGADTYADLASIRAYNARIGQVLPADDATLTANIYIAMQYLEALWDKYKGSRVSDTQPLQWPRSDVDIFGVAWPNNKIPPQLVAALAQLTYDSTQLKLFTTTAGGERGPVVREKVDVIEVQYADSTKTASTAAKLLNSGDAATGAAYELLRPLFLVSSGAELDVGRG